jgi:capsular exopolysaccharide synthesis family protein
MSTSSNAQVSSPKHREWGFEDYLELALRKKWIILTVFAAIFTVSLFYSFTRPDVFSATTTFSIDEETELSGVNSNQSMSSYMYRMGPGKPLEYYNALIGSQPFRDKVIHAALADTLMNSNGNLSSDQVEGALGTLGIRKEDEFSTLLYMNVRAFDPVVAYRIAVIAASAFKERARDVELEQAQNVVNYVVSQVKQAEKKLDEAEHNLQEFKASTKLVISNDNGGILEHLNEIENKITEIETQRELAEANLETYNLRLKQFEASGTPGLMEIESPEITRIRQELDDLEKQKHTLVENGQTQGQKLHELELAIELKKSEIRETALMSVYKNDSKVLISSEKNSEFDILRERKITEELNVYSMTNEETFYKQLRDNYVRQHPDLLENAITLNKLQRSKIVSEDLLNFLIQQGEEARIRAETGTGGLLIVSPASLPLKPIPQNTTRNIAVGFILGIGLGFGLAFVIDFLDQSIRSTDDIVRLTGLPVLGTIPSLAAVPPKGSSAQKKKWSRPELKDGKRNGATGRQYRLLTSIDSKNPLVEAYRNLRTDLQFINVDEPLKLLMLTSATPGEGKTHTSANLAISYSELGEKILLVDCDFRKSQLHKIFQVPRSPGLTDYLARDIPLETIIYQTNIPNLQLIPAGTSPPNPSEMLGSLKMERLIEEMSRLYRLVIFDTPPLMAVSDPKILAPKIGNVLIVIRANKTNYHLIRDANDRLEKVDAHVVGAVLNGVESKRGLGSHRYYQYNFYYDYYYAESGEKKKTSRHERSTRQHSRSERL